MIFWNYCFSYIFKGYQNKGEKYSAHIYALCVMTVLLNCNILSVLFISLPENYLKSKTFKELVIILFVALITLNGLYFLKNERYLKMAAKYQELDSGNKRKGKMFFWIYFISTIILLIFSL
jgi:hypothetical protein